MPLPLPIRPSPSVIVLKAADYLGIVSCAVHLSPLPPIDKNGLIETPLEIMSVIPLDNVATWMRQAGGLVLDCPVEVPPCCAGAHLKLQVGRFVTTSAGVVARRGR